MSTTTLSYNGNKIQPAPFVEIVKNFNRSANGDIIGTTFTINVNGKLYQKCFREEIDAAKHYNYLAQKYHGEFAKLNTI